MAASVTTTLVSRLQHDSLQGRLFTVWSQDLGRVERQLLIILLNGGFLSHAEYREGAGALLLYHQYRAGAPCGLLKKARLKGRGARFISSTALANWVKYTGGATLILSTSRGLLTHTECLRARLGGFITLTLHVNG